MGQLTEACRQEELKLNIIQSRDIRLRPKLAKLCSEEIVIFCKDVQPGTSSCCCTPHLRPVTLQHSLLANPEDTPGAY